MNIVNWLGLGKNYAIHGEQVDHFMELIHLFMFALFVGWTIFFLYTIIRFYRKRSQKADHYGVKSHLSTHLEVGVVIVEAVLLLGFAFPLWAERSDGFADAEKSDPVKVRVIGYQYGWVYHYPGEDGIFGRVDTKTLYGMDGDRNVALDSTCPNAADDFITSELILPAERPAILGITSRDVIHNYAIVPLRTQQDAMPGKEIPMWFTAKEPLDTFVVCAQLCGEGHANMVGNLSIRKPQAYAKWAVDQSKLAKKARLRSLGIEVDEEPASSESVASR